MPTKPSSEVPEPDPGLQDDVTFDLDALRSASPQSAIPVTRVTTHVPVRRPDRRDFFRVHPSADYVSNGWTLDHDDGQQLTTYWVKPAMRAELVEELRLVRIFTCLNRRRTTFLWPIRLPNETDSRGSAWHESALEVAEVAKKSWVRMMGNRDLGAYEYVIAQADLGDPQWPEISFLTLLERAFLGKVIDTVDHPVVRDIRGDLA